MKHNLNPEWKLHAWTVSLCLGIVPNDLQKLEWWIHSISHDETIYDPELLWSCLFQILRQTPKLEIVRDVFELLRTLDSVQLLRLWERNQLWQILRGLALRENRHALFVSEILSMMILHDEYAATRLFLELKNHSPEAEYKKIGECYYKSRKKLKGIQ